ncbi:hypothetical protein [Halobellus captivus]|uniref:hypothetical protein n=1 Tax=Halobellus captivus TaxID=2592614 RepID=UPI0011A7332F|nr:hypothetical protein [Halobellus captivus]
MANYEVIERVVVDRWGDGEGRAEVQAVRIEDTDRYEVRVCYFRDNGQFGQSAPTVSPDEETVERVSEGIEEMAKIARTKEREHRLAEIDTLVEDVGLDRAKQILEEAADEETQ